MAEDTLLDELRADSKPIPKGCTVCAFIEAQPNKASWDAAFHDAHISRAAIWRRMKKLGYEHAEGRLGLHSREDHRGR